MTCPYLDSRDEDVFPAARPYCTVAEQFVEPLRADICHDRWSFAHTAHCEIYRTHEDTS